MNNHINRGKYERSDLTRTRFLLGHSRNRQLRLQAQLQETVRTIKELEAKESELQHTQLEVGAQA